MTDETKPKIKPHIRIYHEDIDNGYFAGWNAGELLVFMVIDRYSNKDTGISYPGYKTIQKSTGLCRAAIRKAITSLCNVRLVMTQLETKEGEHNVYQLTYDRPTAKIAKSREVTGNPFALYRQGNKPDVIAPKPDKRRIKRSMNNIRGSSNNHTGVV